MNQRIKHTEPTTSSYDAVAYGYDYRHDGSGGSAQASQSAAWSRTLTEHRSSSWITDGAGNACTERSRSVNQHLQYLPFGEQFIDQRTNHDIRYKFTTKEEDSEIKPFGADSPNTLKNKQGIRQTGYQYFGARYYSSNISIWLSVDPLASKFPDISPYAYVFNNPVMYVDKWGLFGTKGEAKKFAKENGIKTGWFSKYKFRKSNGRWNIYNKKDNINIFKDSERGIMMEYALREGKGNSSNSYGSSGNTSGGHSSNSFFMGWLINFFGIQVFGNSDGSESVASPGSPQATLELDDLKNWDKPEPYEVELEFLKHHQNQTEPFPRKENMDKNSTVPQSERYVKVPVSEPWTWGRSGGWTEKDSIPQSDSAEYMENYFKKHPNSYYKKEY